MFNSKKIKELEEKLEKLIPCENCKCRGDKEDFIKVTILEKTHWGYGVFFEKGETSLFFCKKCKPDYDYVDKNNYQEDKKIRKPKYYKVIAEHKVEVKLK